MIRRHRNFIIAYVLLVGLPVLILVGTLRAGSKLVPTLSVDGVWKIRISGTSAATLLCLDPMAIPAELPMVISQSGKSMVVTLGEGANISARGMIDGNIVRTFPVQAGKSGRCGNLALSITAHVNLIAAPRSLEGTISADNCSSCPAIDFEAIRQQPNPVVRN